MTDPRPTEFFGDLIEPKAICRNCEYFDGGGLSATGDPINENGDCLNRLSPRFTTTSDQTCSKFFPCSTRWPDADHD